MEKICEPTLKNQTFVYAPVGGTRVHPQARPHVHVGTRTGTRIRTQAHPQARISTRKHTRGDTAGRPREHRRGCVGHPQGMRRCPYGLPENDSHLHLSVAVGYPVVSCWLPCGDAVLGCASCWLAVGCRSLPI